MSFYGERKVHKKLIIHSEAENNIIKCFMLLKMYQQPFAYGLCKVVSCLTKFQEKLFTYMGLSWNKDLCKHH